VFGVQCSGGFVMEKRRSYLDVEGLEVYQLLCQLHIEICDLSHSWPAEERYELGSQIRRSSNSSPAQLAEKNDDRHIRNKIEGINRSRGEASETVHHLFMAHLKKYISDAIFLSYRERYKQCIRMLNGLEKSLEKHIPEKDRRWHLAEATAPYTISESAPVGWPTSSPNPEHRTTPPPPHHELSTR
jgi:four helix bundle protein